MKFHLSDEKLEQCLKKHVPVRLQSPEELKVTLGKNLRTVRLRRNESLVDLAKRAGISEKTLRGLELGEGSTVETLLRVLKALNLLEVVENIAPYVTVDPLALLYSPKPRKRAWRSRFTDDLQI